MSYLTQNEIAVNGSMHNRVAQAAAQEAKGTNPDQWTSDHRRTWASAPGWSEAWESAEASEPGADHGANEAVITDGMILSQVQSMDAVAP